MISGLILSHCLKKNSLGDTYSVLYRCRQYGVDVRDVSKKVEAGVACDFPAETGMNCSSYTHPTVCYDSVLNISQPSVKLSSCPVYLSNPSARDRLFQSPLNPHSCAWSSSSLVPLTSTFSGPLLHMQPSSSLSRSSQRPKHPSESGKYSPTSQFRSGSIESASGSRSSSGSARAQSARGNAVVVSCSTSIL